MHIDKETYKIEEKNRYKTKTAKTQIVIAVSLRKGNRHITRLQHKDYGKTKRWNTFTISREGQVFQHYDTKYNTDFLNIKTADKSIISIVLENMGCLFQAAGGKYINWLNEVCEEERVAKKKWLGYELWEGFPDEQIEATVLLCKELCEEFNIPKTCIDFNTYHKDIAKFRGIVFRSNYIDDSSDINPIIDISKFNEMLKQ